MSLNLEGPTCSVDSASFSGHNKMLASGSWDETIKVWKGETRALLRTLEGHSDAVYQAPVSGFHNFIVSSHDNKLLTSGCV